jgi:D-hexose-6-phosphate mutarotase
VPIEETENRAGLPELLLEHGQSRVRLSLQGAHVTEYSVNNENLLWVSQSARYAPGIAIRGGIPLCWPWFGASLDNADWPQHGFARTSRFRRVGERSDAQGMSVTLALDEAPAIADWQGAASLEVEIRLSDQLWMELRTVNLSDHDLPVGVGLHSYFRISDSHTVSVPALTGLAYLDKPAGFAHRTQDTALHIEGEVDRVYLQAPRTVELIDPARQGAVIIEAWGNTDLVVWNPGPTVAASLGDFDDDGYRQMICIEPALALGNRQRLAPGESIAVGQRIRWARDDTGVG